MKPITIAISILATVGIASAQSYSLPKDTLSLPIRVQVGIFNPSSGSVRDTFGANPYAAGITYDFTAPDRMTDATSYTGVYLDGIYKKSNGMRITVAGLGLYAREYFGDSDSYARAYAGSGLGAYFVDTDTGTQTQNDTRFGWKIFAGYETQAHIYVEASYQMIQKKNDIDPSGLGLFVGFKF